MKPKPTSAAERTGPALRHRHAGQSSGERGGPRAPRRSRREIPGLHLAFHAAADWNDPAACSAASTSSPTADIIVATMLFMEEHAQAVLPAIRARREHCDAVLGCMSAPRDRQADPHRPLQHGRLQARRVRFPEEAARRQEAGRDRRRAAAGDAAPHPEASCVSSPAPRRTCAPISSPSNIGSPGSEENIANLVRFLVNRYADGANAHLRGELKARAAGRISRGRRLPPAPARARRRRASTSCRARRGAVRGAVGLLLMRSYILADNTGPLRRRDRGAGGARPARSFPPSRAGSTRARRSKPSSSATARPRSTRSCR